MKIIEVIVTKRCDFEPKLIVLCFVLMLSGCGLSSRSQAAKIDNYMINGDYDKIAIDTLETENFDKIDIEDIDLLESLNGGTALFLLNDYKSSSLVLEHTNKDISTFFQENYAISGGKAVAETLGNASLFDYRPTIMDNIYLSSYQILSSLGQDDLDGARIGVNIAYEKQKDAADYFNKEIEKAGEESQKDTQKLNKRNRENLDESTNKIISEHFSDLQMWRGYKDYMNPYTTYLSGLFFMTNGRSRGDFESAATYMKRVAGMTPINSFIKNDLKQAEKAANYATVSKDKYVWIIYENGMVADFDEIRINFPAFIVSNQVSILTFSMPKPRLRDQAYPEVLATFDGKTKVRTEVLADVDRMMIAEYNKKLPSIIAKATAKTISGAILQYQMSKELGPWGNLAATAYTMTTASADLRSWHILPKNVQLAKVKLDKKETLELYVNNNIKIGDAKVPTDRNSIVYIRIPSIISKPVISVIKL